MQRRSGTSLDTDQLAQTRSCVIPRQLGLAFAFLALSLPAALAQAADQSWAFKGTVSSYVEQQGYFQLPDLPVGSTVRGQLRFDDAVADTDPQSNSGSYVYQEFVLALEGQARLHLGVDSGTATGDVIGIWNDRPDGGGSFQDRISVKGRARIRSAVKNVMLVNFLVKASGPTPPVPPLQTDSIPAVLPPLSAFSSLPEMTVTGDDGAELLEFQVAVTEFGLVGSPELPLIPNGVTGTPDGSIVWSFSTRGVASCTTGCWVDPPVAESFFYETTNGALFTEIVDFPAGFGSALEVVVDGVSLGGFGPGDSVDFTSQPGGGVTAFEVSGIQPAASLNSATAFPLRLAFDGPAAEFAMTSPELAFIPLLPPIALVALVVLGLAAGSALARSGNRRVKGSRRAH